MSRTRSSITISPVTRARIEIMGFTGRSDRELAGFGPWLRLVPAIVAVWTLVATIAGSPVLFLALVPFFVAGIALPHHPFDAIGNRLRGHRGWPVPPTPAPRRFSYAFASTALLAAAGLFAVSPPAGRALGTLMVVMATATVATQFCLPAWLWGRAASILCRMRGEAAAGQCL